MLQNYFIANGEKYYTGTVIIVEHLGKQVEASFMYYDVDMNKYFYKIKNCTHAVPTEYFNRVFIGATDKTDPTVHLPVIKTKKDFRIDGLFLGWMWYIFLMLISVIFNGAIGLWILISIVFFSWRAKKIKKEGTYIER